MRILFSIIGFLVELVLAVSIGKLLDGAGTKRSTRTESSIRDDPLEFAVCVMCGKPNPVGTASCISCGNQLEPG